MYDISFSKSAEEDFEEAYSYIVQVLKNPNAGKKLLHEAEENIFGIREFPHSCPLVSDTYLRKHEIRFLLVNNYIAFFQVDEENNEILILRFLHGRREWESIIVKGVES